MKMKVSKKGKNPGAVDFWLESLGYFRKNVAYDETCLFRAVSEQLKCTQLHHEEIRKRCITFGKQNSKLFQELVPKKRDWFERLQQLSVHMLICNEIEVQLICKTFKVDIVMFIGATQQIREFKYDITKRSTLYICKMSEDHYDAVYTKEHIENAGFCQSIIYSTVYENVFQIPDVAGVVRKMLHEKDNTCVIYTSDNGHDVPGDESEGHEEYNSVVTYSPNLVAPFPFKIAKALDPDMYRNIEYDTWLEIRRDLRLGDWYYGDDRFIHGTRCVVNKNGKDYICYVQNIKKKQNMVEVYVTECGQRWVVDYSELQPEADARPWPLPYRFTKNLALQAPNSTAPENERKGLRKRREKKQVKAEKNEEREDLTNGGVENFRGCPLLMRNLSDEATSTAATSSSNLLESGSDENANLTAVEPLHWQPPLVQEETFPSLLNSMTPANDSPIFYSDSEGSPYYCNFNTEFSYPSPLPIWPPPQYVLTPEPGTNDTRPQFVDYNRNTPKVVFYPTDICPSPNYVTSPMPFPAPPQMPSVSPDKVMCNTPVTPGPHMDIYPMMYPMQPPSAPIYYSHTPSPIPTTRPADCLIPTGSPMPVYNSPIDLQYMSPSAYIYPPTPPVAWYPPHVNAQGFIYPTSYNN